MINQIGRFLGLVGLRVLLCLCVSTISIGMTEYYKKWVHQNQVNQMFNQSQREYPHVVAWDQIDPLEFVETLKNWPGPCVTISNAPPIGWINPVQRFQLSRLLQNQEPAASITHPFCSFQPKKRIPVGVLVQYLVQFDSVRKTGGWFSVRGQDDGPTVSYSLGLNSLHPGPFIDDLQVTQKSQNKETIQPPHARGLTQRGASVDGRVGRRCASR